ncbi:MAG: helix-turn-helix transcriptional regulator [Clostridia bacterium]|jgi:DNA-binding XRE family transcriptional regulator|nr:helix-turn-helix transcriptional regulator [Clostridia bacterium]
MILPNLKTRIKEYRAKLDMTQDDLAKLVNVRRETIIHLEKGKYNPSLKLAYDIAKALNATIDDLFSYNDD